MHIYSDEDGDDNDNDGDNHDDDDEDDDDDDDDNDDTDDEYHDDVDRFPKIQFPFFEEPLKTKKKDCCKTACTLLNSFTVYKFQHTRKRWILRILWSHAAWSSYIFIHFLFSFQPKLSSHTEKMVLHIHF